jgi:hypothetical protein
MMVEDSTDLWCCEQAAFRLLLTGAYRPDWDSLMPTCDLSEYMVTCF